jgi:hypothetical protein
MRHAATTWLGRTPERLGAARAHVTLCHGVAVEDSMVTQQQARLHREVRGDTTHSPCKKRRVTGHHSSVMTGRWISPACGGVLVKEGDAVVGGGPSEAPMHKGRMREAT